MIKAINILNVVTFQEDYFGSTHEKLKFNFQQIRNGFIGSSEHTVSMNLPHPPTQTYTKLAGNISRQQLHLVLPVAL